MKHGLHDELSSARLAIEDLERRIRDAAAVAREADPSTGEEAPWTFLEQAADKANEAQATLLYVRCNLDSARLRGWAEA